MKDYNHTYAKHSHAIIALMLSICIGLPGVGFWMFGDHITAMVIFVILGFQLFGVWAIRNL